MGTSTIHLLIDERRPGEPHAVGRERAARRRHPAPKAPLAQVLVPSHQTTPPQGLELVKVVEGGGVAEAEVVAEVEEVEEESPVVVVEVAILLVELVPLAVAEGTREEETMEVEEAEAEGGRHHLQAQMNHRTAENASNGGRLANSTNLMELNPTISKEFPWSEILVQEALSRTRTLPIIRAVTPRIPLCEEVERMSQQTTSCGGSRMVGSVGISKNTKLIPKTRAFRTR